MKVDRKWAGYPNQLLVQIAAPHFTAGLVFERGQNWRCTEAAPILGWCRGKHLFGLRTYFEHRKGWGFEEVMTEHTISRVVVVEYEKVTGIRLLNEENGKTAVLGKDEVIALIETLIAVAERLPDVKAKPIVEPEQPPKRGKILPKKPLPMKLGKR